MATTKVKTERRKRRHQRVRARVVGTTERPRLCVHKSNKYISAQVIDDAKGVTVATASSREIGKEKVDSDAEFVGSLIAERAAKEGVTQVVFDRSGYAYRGRVQKLADAARGGGIKF